MYECHITIDPVFGERRKECELVAYPHSFKLAKLLMVKDGKEEESDKDTFMTAHHLRFGVLQKLMESCIRDLMKAGFAIRRYKIELIVLDSRDSDYLKIVCPESIGI